MYEGDKIPDGKKSYGINFDLSNKNKTLEEREIKKTMSKICSLLEKKFNWTGILCEPSKFYHTKIQHCILDLWLDCLWR